MDTEYLNWFYTHNHITGLPYEKAANIRQEIKRKQLKENEQTKKKLDHYRR